ncbi:MAG: glutamate formimidoyltransferase [Chloroflexi bacterium]|nr:glutamate formimidoyltransferase [Chloroflexota bacterium]
MPGLIECIPNFSEGRSATVVERIVAAMAAVAGVRVLDYSLNPDHHRSVVTLVGSGAAVAEAAFRGIQAARDTIDLRQHAGVHPRIGAADVVPFVPLAGTRLEACIELARALGARVAAELGIPVYLYEAAATRPERRDLAEVRRGQYEALVAAIETDPSRAPDFGPARLHPSAGAVAIGARRPLLAFNVNLRTDDVAIAEALARAVRQRSGGLRSVKALGVRDAGQAQVTMNLTDPRATPPHRALALLRAEAERYGVAIAGSEIVGLAPLDSLLQAAEHALSLSDFRREQVLEWQVLAQYGPDAPIGEADAVEPEVTPYLEALASAAPTPGGGSAAALAGALAAALGEMVANLTVGQEKFAAVEDRVQTALTELTHARRQLTAAMAEDAAAFDAYMAARRLPRATPEERAARAAAVQTATLVAAQAPLRVARQCLALLPWLDTVAEYGNPNVASDAGAGAILSDAAVRASALNVRVNLLGLADVDRRALLTAELAEIEAAAATQAAAIVARVTVIIGGAPP